MNLTGVNYPLGSTRSMSGFPTVVAPGINQRTAIWWKLFHTCDLGVDVGGYYVVNGK